MPRSFGLTSAVALVAAAAAAVTPAASTSLLDAPVGEYRWVSVDTALTFGFTSPIGFR